MDKDIFTWVKEEETRYAQDIQVMENWAWNMKEHIRTSILFKHGKFKTASNTLETKSPNRNIVYPLLNLRYRAEDLDLKDVALYVNDAGKYHLSFLIKKYHDEKYVVEHDLDTFFDETKEEKIDLGGTLARKGPDGPVYEPLDSIAFCDQTDILSGPIAFKGFFSPDELYEKEALGWGKVSNGATTTIDSLVTLADAAKVQDSQVHNKTLTPGKYIELYRIHGSMPISWLKESDQAKFKPDEKYVRQLHIIGFYKDKDGKAQGITLYRAREYDNPFKLNLSGKKLRNRALAFGGVEELFEPQIWTNYSEIRKKDMLDAASKIVFQTSDEAFSSRNKIKDMENLEITVVRDQAEIKQIPNGSPNIQLFNEWIQSWEMQGQSTAGATDALLGKNPTAGAPFKLQNIVVQQGLGLHDYRKGKFATWVAEIYQDWIIPDIAREITTGTEFLATLSSDEMEYVADCMARSQLHNEETEIILNGGNAYTEAERAQKAQKIREDFGRGGSKKFIRILKDEFKDVSLSVRVNVAGKQKDLAAVVDKMVNVFRQVLSNPAVLQDPKAAKVFNKLIEYSGLDPIDFGYASSVPQQPPQPLPQPVQTQTPPAKQPALI